MQHWGLFRNPGQNKASGLKNGGSRSKVIRDGIISEILLKACPSDTLSKQRLYSAILGL